jgi:hypothetical protein
MSRNTTRLFFALILAITVLILTTSGRAYFSVQELRYNTKYECNGEAIVVGHCRSDDDGPGMPRTQPSADYCMVYYPSRPKRGGFTVQEAELKSDVMRKLTACNALRSPEPVSAPTTPLANAETPAPRLNHYSKDGLAFDYPADDTLEDKSVTGGAQNVFLTHTGGAQIVILSRYDKLDTAEQIAKARKEVYGAFIESMVKYYDDHQVKVERSERQIAVGGKQASGVRLRSDIDEGPHNVDIYALVLGRRLVVVSFTVSDEDLDAAAPTWAIVRSSLEVQSAPGLKHYSKDGLAFDYPADVTLEDKSVTVAQNRETAAQVLYLAHAAGSGADSVAQISIVSRYDMLDTAEQIAEARKDVFDVFIDTILKGVQAKLERSEKQIVVGGKQASGVRLRGMFKNRPYDIEVYSLVIGRRLVVLSFQGYDTALESAASAWEIVRSSLKVH